MENTSTSALAIWLDVALGFIRIGVFTAKTLGEKHLTWDRRTGYWIYRKRLEKTGDEKQAIAAAAVFYRVFGLFFIGMGAPHFFIVAAVLLARLPGGASN